MSLSPEDLKLAMSNKSNEELYDILYAHSEDYTTDALEIAKEEFLGRKLDAPTLRSLSTAVGDAKTGDARKVIDTHMVRALGRVAHAARAWILASSPFFPLLVPRLLGHG